MKKISYIFEFYAIISGFMTMQERFDIELDPYALAKQGRSVSGRLVAKSLSRVVDLVGSEAEFEAQLDFGIDPNGLRIVSGAVQGKVTLQCQRCLDAAAQSSGAGQSSSYQRIQTYRSGQWFRSFGNLGKCFSLIFQAKYRLS